MVWKQGLACVSEASRYHPFRCRNALCTFPSASLATIDSPTYAVRAARSLFSAAWMACCMRWPSDQRSWPARRSNVRCIISNHVLLLIQSCQWAFVVPGSLQATFIFLKAHVISSCCSKGGRCSGNSCHFLQYSFSRLLPVRMVPMTARWSES
jgi:hypothetical protein